MASESASARNIVGKMEKNARITASTGSGSGSSSATAATEAITMPSWNA